MLHFKCWNLVGHNFGSIIGPALGGAINTYLGWKWNFYINGCLALTITVFWIVLIFDTPHESTRISAEELEYICSNIIVEKTNDEMVPKIPPYMDMIKSIKVWAVVMKIRKELLFSSSSITVVLYFFRL